MYSRSGLKRIGNNYRYSGPNIFFLISQKISGLNRRLDGDLLSKGCALNVPSRNISCPGKANQQGSFNYAVMTPIWAEYFYLAW